MWQYNYTDELYHYGVLGMKWGVRKASSRGDYATVGKHYSKASAKKQKLYDTVEKRQKQYNKAVIKANTGAAAKYKKLETKAVKAKIKADKASAKKDKMAKKYYEMPLDNYHDRYVWAKNKSAASTAKYNKVQSKADKYKETALKREAKAGIAEARLAKAQMKAAKFSKAMDKVFTKDIKSKAGIGEDYVKNLKEAAYYMKTGYKRGVFIGDLSKDIMKAKGKELNDLLENADMVRDDIAASKKYRL